MQEYLVKIIEFVWNCLLDNLTLIYPDAVERANNLTLIFCGRYGLNKLHSRYEVRSGQSHACYAVAL